MIVNLVTTRVEPCFWGENSKPACGEASRVKKDSSGHILPNIPSKPEGVDTFTSSKEAKTDEKVSKGNSEKVSK